MQGSLRVLGGLVLLAASAFVYAEDKPAGFLCCNMRTDGKWISDINYDENGKRIIPGRHAFDGYRLWPLPRQSKNRR